MSTSVARSTSAPASFHLFYALVAFWLVGLVFGLSGLLWTKVPTTVVPGNYPIPLDITLWLLSGIVLWKFLRVVAHSAEAGESLGAQPGVLLEPRVLFIGGLLGATAAGLFVQTLIELTGAAADLPYPSLNMLFGASHGVFIVPAVGALWQVGLLVKRIRARGWDAEVEIALEPARSALVTLLGWIALLLVVDFAILSATTFIHGALEITAWSIFAIMALTITVGASWVVGTLREARCATRWPIQADLIRRAAESRENWLSSGNKQEEAEKYRVVREMLLDEQKTGRWPFEMPGRESLVLIMLLGVAGVGITILGRLVEW